MRSVGEKPTIYNSSLTLQTVEQIQLYLNQNGYFRASVKSEIQKKKKKLQKFKRQKMKK